MTIYTANPGDDLFAKCNSLVAGDALILNDGTYPVNAGCHGLQIRGRVGTLTQPIVIIAANDGKAIIDGQSGSQGNYEPVYVSNSSYVIIEGLQCKNSYASVYKVDSSVGVGNGPCDHITIRRCTGTGAGAGNHHIFDIAFGPTNTLFEDCAAWGPGRYMFLAYHTQNTTFRRCYGYWNTVGFNNTLLQPRSPFGNYGSQNTTFENCIGRHSYPSATDDVITNNYFTALYQTSDDQTNFPVTNAQVLGCIFYDNWEGYWLNSDASGGGTVIKDCYFECPLDTNPTDQYTTTNQGDGLHIAGNTYSHTITNCTFVNSREGYSSSGTIGTITLENSVFYNNTQGIVTDPGHTYCDFFGNSNDSNPPLTLYGVAGVSPTLSTATQLVTSLGGTESSIGNTTNGTVTPGWLEAQSKNGSLQTVQASLPSTPSGKGWIFDTIALEGQTFPSGQWSGSTTYATSTMANATFSGTRRWWVRHADGTYTLIGTISLISPTFGASGVHKVFTFPSTTFASVSFGIGDKLYMEEWLNAAWGSVSGVGFSVWQCSGFTQGLANHIQTNAPTYALTLAAGDKVVDPGYDTVTYGRGGAFSIKPTSPLHGAGNDGSDIGANILYQYVNGALTPTPLWPWPMESRVMTELGISPTYQANGGVWTTLSGIYIAPPSDVNWLTRDMYTIWKTRS